MNGTTPGWIVTGDGSRTLVGEGGEGYKSRHGAVTEARAVYLGGSGAGVRLAAGAPTRVLEVGFGAAPNFLVTAAAAAAGGARLDYLALELAPPPTSALAALGYADLLAPSPLPPALLAWRERLGEAVPAGRYVFAHGGVHLELVVGDATTGAWDGREDRRVHAVYHDAFSPATAPELWTPGFLGRLAARLEPGGALVSFCVAGAVRRALAGHGLLVERVPGPAGGKRAVLVARRPADGA